MTLSRSLSLEIQGKDVFLSFFFFGEEEGFGGRSVLVLVREISKRIKGMDSVKYMEAASDSHTPGTTASVALNTTSSGRTGCGDPTDNEKGQQQTTITTAAVTNTSPTCWH